VAPEEKVLSQAEIDALVGKVPSKPAPKPAAPAPAAPAPVAAAPKPEIKPATAPVEANKPGVAIGQLRDGTAKYEKYTSTEVSNLQSVVVDLARQVAKMTNAMQRLEKAENKVAQIYSLLKLDPEETETLGGRLDKISGRVEELARHYSDYQNEFQCSHCKSTQMMALHVKCTTCGEEAWMGWWPEGNKKK
jgi:predicted RNase H-like nuclease (RuvC/YqgF family)